MKNKLISSIKESNLSDSELAYIYNQVMYVHVESSVNLLFQQCSAHAESEKVIREYIKNSAQPYKDKIRVIQYITTHRIDKNNFLQNGVAQKLSDFYRMNYAWIYNVPFFKEFVKWLSELKLNPQGQGATGVGRGEHLLIILCKNGEFATKGDVLIGNDQVEVKNGGEIYKAPKQYREIEQIIELELGVKNVTNLGRLVKCFNNLDRDRQYILDMYSGIYKHMFSDVPEVYDKIDDIFNATLDKDGRCSKEDILLAFKRLNFSLYQEEYGFDYCVFFNFKDGDEMISAVQHESQICKENGYKIDGLNFKNGYKGSALTIKLDVSRSRKDYLNGKR